MFFSHMWLGTSVLGSTCLLQEVLLDRKNLSITESSVRQLCIGLTIPYSMLPLLLAFPLLHLPYCLFIYISISLLERDCLEGKDISSPFLYIWFWAVLTYCRYSTKFLSWIDSVNFRRQNCLYLKTSNGETITWQHIAYIYISINNIYYL